MENLTAGEWGSFCVAQRSLELLHSGDHYAFNFPHSPSTREFGALKWSPAV